MIVVDVNIVAYFFIEGQYTTPARDLWKKDPDWRMPPLWRHEYLNVLVSYVRHGGAQSNAMVQLWRQAVTLFRQADREIDWERALWLAIDRNISAYDAQYLALAEALDTFCVTQDKKLLQAFPQRACSLEQFLEND